MISGLVAALDAFLWTDGAAATGPVRALRAALRWSLFDQDFYLLVHPDVRRSGYGTMRQGGLRHFLAHGRAEGRLWRRTPPGLRRARLRFAWLRVRGDHWSGIRVASELADGRTEAGEVVVVRPFPPALRRVPFSAAEVEPDGGIQVHWAAEARSAGGRRLVWIRRRGGFVAFANAVRDTAAPAVMPDGLIHSPGESPWRLPRALVVSPVTQCNLNCVHCISRSTRKTLSILPDGVWAEIEEAIRAAEIEHLACDYSGDIFHSTARRGPFLDRMVATGAALRIDTHANDLTDDVAETLLASKLFSLNFSLDAMHPDTYRKIRKGAIPHHEVLANIRRFMEKKYRRRPDVTTVLSFVLMRSNIAEFGEAIDFVVETGIDVLQGNHLMVFTDDMVEESLLLDPAAYAARWAEIRALAEARGVTDRIRLPDPVSVAAPRRGHRACNFPYEAAVVLGNGDVLACCTPGSKVGNLAGTSLAEIWNGPAYRAFRARVNTADPPAVCDACPFYRFDNNFRSYVPGLSEPARTAFEARCFAARTTDASRPS